MTVLACACSIRFVPDQRPEDLLDKLKQHVERIFAALHSSNTVSVRVKSIGDWWEADPQSKLFRLAERALHREWNVWPLYVREGGTMVSKSWWITQASMGIAWAWNQGV